MTHLLVRHTVSDYEKWKPVFDAHASTRKAAGSRGGALYRSRENPNEIFVFFDWESEDRARAFATSQELTDVMARAGVTEVKSVTFLDMAVDFSV